jgi:hypothetical protein
MLCASLTRKSLPFLTLTWICFTAVYIGWVSLVSPRSAAKISEVSHSQSCWIRNMDFFIRKWAERGLDWFDGYWIATASGNLITLLLLLYKIQLCFTEWTALIKTQYWGTVSASTAVKTFLKSLTCWYDAVAGSGGCQPCQVVWELDGLRQGPTLSRLDCNCKVACNPWIGGKFWLSHQSLHSLQRLHFWQTFELIWSVITLQKGPHNCYPLG